jgi:hypothetical protein
MNNLLYAVSRKHLIQTRDDSMRDLLDPLRRFETEKLSPHLHHPPIELETLRWQTALAENAEHLIADIFEEICGGAWRRELSPAIRKAYHVPVRTFAVTAMALRDICPI